MRVDKKATFSIDEIDGVAVLTVNEVEGERYQLQLKGSYEDIYRNFRRFVVDPSYEDSFMFREYELVTPTHIHEVFVETVQFCYKEVDGSKLKGGSYIVWKRQ